MFHKRLADKIKAGFAWSVISEDGECIPAKDHACGGESNDVGQSFLPLKVVSPDIAEVQQEVSLCETIPLTVDSPWNMEKVFNNSERKFQPEFLLKRPEKEESTVAEPAVKRPTAAFRVDADQKNESGEGATIGLPDELVQSSELLAESVISMSVSVLSAEKSCEDATRKELKELVASERNRSIEFRSFAG